MGRFLCPGPSAHHSPRRVLGTRNEPADHGGAEGQKMRIALPNKGRLAEGVRTLFERAGLDLRFRGDRALQASFGEGRTALFVRSADIPEFVANGAADLGRSEEHTSELQSRPHLV